MSASDWWELELSLKMTLTDVILFTYINYSKQKRHIEYHDKLGSHGITWTFVLFQHDCIQSKLHKDMDEELGLEELCTFGMNQSNMLLEKWPKNFHKPHGKPSQETFTQVILICVWGQMSEYFQQCSVFLILLLKLGVENVLEQKSICNNAVVIKP